MYHAIFGSKVKNGRKIIRTVRRGWDGDLRGLDCVFLGCFRFVAKLVVDGFDGEAWGVNRCSQRYKGICYLKSVCGDGG